MDTITQTGSEIECRQILRKGQMSMFFRIVFGMLCSLAIASACLADEATKSRFLTEYPREAKFVKDRWDRCSGTIRMVSPDGKPSPQGLNAKFWRSHGFEKYEHKTDIPTKTGKIVMTSVECAGDDGTFFILTSDSEHPGFKARKVSSDEKSIKAYEQNAGRIIRANLGGYRKPLITMLDEKTAELVDANPVPGNTRLIEATFRVENGTRISQLVVRFDTSNHWSVVQQGLFIDAPPKNTTTYQIEYGKEIDGISMPRKVSMTDKTVDYVISDWKFDETPKQAFTTAHYGLADLVEAKKAQDVQEQKKRGVTKLTWYLFGGAVVATLAGLAFFYLSNRKPRSNSEAVS
jgi:hypothetical protein